ncbi:hypothetical protein EV176_003914 [Coemansia sp. RSA 451]|nr:hypothetical protein EV176_003914 [Coemansia sp. RSA 451]
MCAGNELVAIIANQESREAEETKLKNELAYLQDVHLAVALQRLDQQTIRLFLKTFIYVSDVGDVCIVLRDQQLGEGWLGRATFESSIAEHKLSLDSKANVLDQNSVFHFQLPTHCVEWTVRLALVYEPQYKVPAYVSIPASTYISSHHIDALDFIVPCSGIDQAATPAATELPHVCEIWLALSDSDSRISTGATCVQAQRLLSALLFENLPPQAHKRIRSIMVGSYTAEFCLFGVDDSQSSTTVMCVPEHGHLALRISSPCALAYCAVVAAIAERLMLLLGASSDGNVSFAVLSDLRAECAEAVGGLLVGSGEPDTPSRADFALVEHAQLDLLDPSFTPG